MSFFWHNSVDFSKKKKKTGQTSVAQSFRNHNTVSREKAEMRLSGIGFVKNILLWLQLDSICNDYNLLFIAITSSLVTFARP